MSATAQKWLLRAAPWFFCPSALSSSWQLASSNWLAVEPHFAPLRRALWKRSGR